MNNHDFVSHRDEIALASMLERGRKLEVQADEALGDVRRLRAELAQYPAPASGLQYNLTKEQFDERIRIINIREKIETELSRAYRAWANYEAMIGDIERDERYIEWVKQSEEIAS